MKTIAFAAATALAIASYAPTASAMGQEFNMLTGAVFNELSSRGFDTSTVGQLTLSDIAKIKGLLDEGDMTGSIRGQIEKILSK